MRQVAVATILSAVLGCDYACPPYGPDPDTAGPFCGSPQGDSGGDEAVPDVDYGANPCDSLLFGQGLMYETRTLNMHSETNELLKTIQDATNDAGQTSNIIFYPAEGQYHVPQEVTPAVLSNPHKIAFLPDLSPPEGGTITSVTMWFDVTTYEFDAWILNYDTPLGGVNIDTERVRESPDGVHSIVATMWSGTPDLSDDKVFELVNIGGHGPSIPGLFGYVDFNPPYGASYSWPKNWDWREPVAQGDFKWRPTGGLCITYEPAGLDGTSG